MKTNIADYRAVVVSDKFKCKFAAPVLSTLLCLLGGAAPLYHLSVFECAVAIMFIATLKKKSVCVQFVVVFWSTRGTGKALYQRASLPATHLAC